MKTILALAWSADDTTTFDVAGSLAKRHGSHVIGLAPPSFRAVSVAWAEAGMGAPFDMLDDDEEEKRRIEGLRQAFDARMAAAGIGKVAAGALEGGACWADSDHAAPATIGANGRAADIMIVPQPGGPPKMPESIFEGALFESGRPVLMVPQGAPAEVGRRVVVAWNGSTETARAIAMASSLLKSAEAVSVISVEGAMVPGPSAEELALSLRRHGLTVTVRHYPVVARSTGHTLVEASQEVGADLIIKGAYTQSRLRQLIFGGLTRHLITASPIPVLFAH
ncbi:MAG: universal stress protein [Rhodospirillales bacterium]|nr:MAG: universal stress protein [Rhodospirillales bacterium]